MVLMLESVMERKSKIGRREQETKRNLQKLLTKPGFRPCKTHRHNVDMTLRTYGIASDVRMARVLFLLLIEADKAEEDEEGSLLQVGKIKQI